MAEAVKSMRNGNINTVPGYDDEFGIVKVFEPGELEKNRNT